MTYPKQANLIFNFVLMIRDFFYDTLHVVKDK